MLKNLMQGLGKGVVTSRYPRRGTEVPERFRGAPEPVIGLAFDDLPAGAVCPTGAIAADRARGVYSIDLARCVFCGSCSEACRGGSLKMSSRFELSGRLRRDLLLRVRRDDEGRITEAPEDATLADEAADRVRRRIRETLGRSLQLRHLDSGSCNACDWELSALLAPHYDCRRLGVDFVASPRHADGLMVTGCMTRNLEVAALRTYEAVPEPKLVIAVGACASSGGVAGTSYASLGGAAAILPVDVYVPGCPPRPEAMLFGILLALGRIEGRPG
jgi:Ni,Fe-hydrogenase III small subunit/formate hydrogenlyase subunit 6/NADH:ubiquinone oxidoreductase subunit I